MTSHRIGVNLRVSGNCDQGARKYMEDNHVIKFLKKDTDDYEFAYFGIFDGHGGPEASAFCRDNLLNEITKYDGFWTNDDDLVLTAIRKGFLDTHNNMWNVLDSWPKTVTGLPSTAGSTATIAIIKQGKLYTGHVGDSGLVLGENDLFATNTEIPVQAICVTKEHKPDDPDERERIVVAGGEVINKSGVPRVVWSRPKTNHKGPIRRSTQIDQIPFLAVSRSLGDLWSYDYYTETYVVSPEPDVAVLPLDPSKHRCLILASDGLWNMLTPEESVNMVMALEGQFEERIINDPNVAVSFWSNPAERLVGRALNKWRSKALKADNTSCVVVLVDPLGPSKLTLLKRKRQELLSGGEIPASTQANKLISRGLNTSQLKPSVPVDLDHRGKPRNKNANCSLSDSHIRVTDDSILEPPTLSSVTEENSAGPPPPHLGRYGSSSGPPPSSDHTTANNESINDSVQYFPPPGPAWNLRHSRHHDTLNASRGVSTGTDRRHHTLPSGRDKHSPEESGGFTRLTSSSRLGPHDASVREGGRHPAGYHYPLGKAPVGHLIVDEDMEDFEGSPMEVERDSDSDYGEGTIPVPPPCTPCDNNVDQSAGSENSLHSSADVTDLAFSLASDESLGTPDPSFDGKRPVTPLSAPAKLNSTRGRRAQMSRSAKRKLVVKPGKKVANGAGKSNQRSKGKTPGSPATFKIPAALKKSPSTLLSSVELTKAVEKYTSKLTKEIDSQTAFSSPPKQVLSTSKTMNDAATTVTPKNRRKASASSGLTPTMSLLRTDAGSVNRTVPSQPPAQPLYSLMTTDLRDCNTRHESTMTGEDLDTTVDHPVEPLKQLNKTGPIKKTGSKRWGNFFRASKLGFDQIFHHNPSSKRSGPKLATLSTSQIETEYNRDTNPAVSLKNTSVSTSKLGDYTLANLPDVTVSHFANGSTLGDLTTLSALSADDSLLTAEAIHHSMLEEGQHSKVGGKSRKGFLQKTRFTLRRAKKAAKKAFFPENHRLKSATGKKRKSDEFLPTPEMKRRHVEGEVV